MSVSLFVSLLTYHKNRTFKYHPIYCTFYLWLCGSVLFWQQCDTLCTSGFVDDVMYSHNKASAQNQRRRVCFDEFARWRHRRQRLLSRLHLVHFWCGEEIVRGIRPPSPRLKAYTT